jgi:hypothetical protein|tara:strand:+ start:12107 stop:12277 length:171 start_codon:yes stop_codon:yes gene_type:complete
LEHQASVAQVEDELRDTKDTTTHDARNGSGEYAVHVTVPAWVEVFGKAALSSRRKV